AAVGSGVHYHCSAKSSRNTAREFKAGKRGFPRRCRHGGQKRAGTGTYFSPFEFYISHIAVHLNDHAPVSAVAHQKVASVSQHKIWKSFFPAQRKRAAYLLIRFRHQEYLCRSADTECGMTAHRLFKKHLVFSQKFAKFLSDFFFHRFSSSIFPFIYTEISRSYPVFPAVKASPAFPPGYLSQPLPQEAFPPRQAQKIRCRRQNRPCRPSHLPAYGGDVLLNRPL